MKRILIPNEGTATPETIAGAVVEGISQCKAYGASRLVLITPTKDRFDRMFVEVFGQSIAHKLAKGAVVSIPDADAQISHESVVTAIKNPLIKIGLVFYASSDQISRLDERFFDCLLFVPWKKSEGNFWAEKWQAEVLGGEPAAPIALPIQVQEALRGLTSCVNLTTGLTHSSDKEHAKRKFADLKAEGIQWVPAEIEKWAAQNGWQSRDAEALALLSRKYL